MIIQVNTDNNVAGRETMAKGVEETLTHILARFADRITRLEVHLSDENSAAKSGVPDKRCMLEARLAGRDPAAVTDVALTLDAAVNGAGHKMVSRLESDLGKLGKH